MKKIFLVLITAIIVLSDILAVSAYDELSDYVIDNADILNEATEGYISQNSRKLMDAREINITVVTVEEKKIDDYEAYFNDAAKKYDIDNGIVIFVAEGLGSIATYSTKGMKAIISDETLAYIRQNCIPGLQAGVLDFDKAILNLYRSILVELNVDVDEKPVDASRDAYFNFLRIIPIIAGYCIFIILIFEVFLKKLYAIYKARVFKDMENETESRESV